ncbi:LEA type 2 family protein [Natrononativus amylolyticus]|uniref:LEA type 2 family protein n=1 Tax=Natrononativus amylolyticus TaxID=2963434 RepID=UPI0020CF9845|nr:LEA type 2 family protein [Natrononativus amylolyticus]
MSRVRAAFFGSKLRALATIGVLLLVTLGGAVAGGLLGVPSVVGLENTFGEVTEDSTAVETELVVSNPNPIGVDTDDVSVSYALAMNDVDMARGERRGVTVGTGNSTVPLTTDLDNGAIPAWWVSHVDAGERTTVAVDATVSSDRLGREGELTHEHGIETDVIGEFNSTETRPVNANQPLIDDPVLYVNETTGEWGDVSESETPIETAFVVYNPNDEPYVITELGYEITMNDVDVGSGATHDTHVIGGGETETLEATTAIDATRLDEWWVTHLDDGVHGHQVSELRIEFYAVVELPTGEAVTVPLEELTHEDTLETDVFDEGLGTDRTPSDGDSSESDDGSSDGGDASDDDSAADDGNDTADGSENETDEGDTDDEDDTDDVESDDDDTDDEDDDDGISIPLLWAGGAGHS